MSYVVRAAQTVAAAFDRASDTITMRRSTRGDNRAGRITVLGRPEQRRMNSQLVVGRERVFLRFEAFFQRESDLLRLDAIFPAFGAKPHFRDAIADHGGLAGAPVASLRLHSLQQRFGQFQ